MQEECAVESCTNERFLPEGDALEVETAVVGRANPSDGSIIRPVSLLLSLNPGFLVTFCDVSFATTKSLRRFLLNCFL